MYQFEIPGPISYGPAPQPARRPLEAEIPAGPRSLPWPVNYYGRVQPQLAFAPGDLPYNRPWWQDLIGGFVDPWFNNGTEQPNDWSGLPPYNVPPVTTYAPHCQSVWPWVLGTAVVMMIVLGGNKK